MTWVLLLKAAKARGSHSVGGDKVVLMKVRLNQGPSSIQNAVIVKPLCFCSDLISDSCNLMLKMLTQVSHEDLRSVHKIVTQFSLSSTADC